MTLDRKDAAVSRMGEAAILLVEWFGHHARQMPWRDDPTPYHVWLSEIMLQQTRVEAVRGYYNRFLEELPDIEAMAKADEGLVLKLWEGLGYYTRARNLQKAAKLIMEDYGGELPGDYGELLKLPGIGEYTAGAIGAIAFGLPVPAVDGNVLRVMARILEDSGDISSTTTKQRFRDILAEAIPTGNPGDFTQALMELGATVCIPNGIPGCDKCPLSGLCGAHQSGRAGELPVKTAKKSRKREPRTVILLVGSGKLLLFRREKGLLIGLYEPLNLAGHLDEPAVREACAAMGGKPERMEYLGEAVHIFTHVEWHMRGYLVYTQEFIREHGVWAGLPDIRKGLAIPSAFRAFTKDLEIYLNQG